MAEAVVDGLEVVDVHEQDGHRTVVPLLSLQGVLHPVSEQGSVGEASGRVVERLMRELLFEQLALADVAGVEDDATDLGVQREVRKEGLDVQPGPVAVAPPELEQLGVDHRVVEDLGEEIDHPGQVLGMNHVEQLRPDQAVRVVAHDSVDRRALIADRGVGGDDGHHVGRVLNERGEPDLALSPVQVFVQEGALQGEGDLRRERVDAVPDLLRELSLGSQDQQAPKLLPDVERCDRDGSHRVRHPQDLTVRGRRRHQLDDLPLGERTANALRQCGERDGGRGVLRPPAPERIASRSLTERGHHGQVAIGLAGKRHPDLRPSAHQLSGGSDGRLVQGVPSGRSDEGGTGLAKGPFPRLRQLVLAHQAAHPGDGEGEQRDRSDHDQLDVERLSPERLGRHDHGSHQRAARQQDQPPGAEPPFPPARGLGQRPHRRVKSGGAPQQVEGEPSDLQWTAVLAAHSRQLADPERGVGHEQRHRAVHEQVERRLLEPRSHGEPHQDRHQEHIHHRVGHGDEPHRQRQREVAGVGGHQEFPCHQAQPDGHDQRVDQAVPVSPGRAAPDHRKDAGGEQRIDAQIEGVADRRGPDVMMEPRRIVRRDDITNDKQRKPCSQHRPWQAAVWLVHPHPSQDGADRRRSERIEERRALVLQWKRWVDGASKTGEGKVDQPPTILHTAYIGVGAIPL